MNRRACAGRTRRLLTLLHKRGGVSAAIERLKPTASALNRLPGVLGYYRYLLPVMPLAVPRVPACDLVLSFSHCVAKGARPPAGVPHVCYCFSPMRYAWHQREAYFARGPLGGLKARCSTWCWAGCGRGTGGRRAA